MDWEHFATDASLESLFAQLSLTLGRFREAGLRVPEQSRFSRLEKSLDAFISGRSRRFSLEALLEGACDLEQLSAIAFRRRVMSKALGLLAPILGGPVVQADEKKTYPRDMLFQLFMTAAVDASGCDFDIQEPDSNSDGTVAPTPSQRSECRAPNDSVSV